MRSRIAALLVVLAMAGAGGAADAAGKGAKPQAPRTEAELIAQHRFAPEEVGYVLFDPKSGGVLTAKNAHRPFIPASVSKVPSAVAALAVLGPEHRFETRLLADGRIEGGVLEGDLYLRGGGDPFLMTEDLHELVDGLLARGITRVAGRFLYDATLLPVIQQIDPLQPDAAQYNAGISALSLNHNRVAFAWRHDGDLETLAAETFSESRTGRMPLSGIRYDAAPPGADPSIPLVRAARSPGEHWLISPRIAKQGRTWLPLRRPEVVAAEIFRALCADAGIELPPPEAGVTPDTAEVLAVHRSEPLVEIVRATLRYSNNLAAELVGLATASALEGRPLSLDRASARVAEWYRSRMPAVDWTGFAPGNFSGLSSAARVTPAQIAAVLVMAAQESGEGDLFALLPQQTWTVGNGKSTGIRGKKAKTVKPKPPDFEIRAKTGTVAYGSGLAGYIDRRGGSRLGFVILVSDLEARREFDASNRVRSLLLPREAKAWLRRARGLARELVLKWAG